MVIIKNTNLKSVCSALFFLTVFIFSNQAFSVEKTKYEFKTEKYKLSNGMTVILHQDNKLPIYSLHLWYKIGSSDEESNKTGLAHFFEHLMFKGTQKYKEGAFDSIIEDNGGANNAFTNRDSTGYYVDMPSGTLNKILELEADRMKNLEITLDKVKREREVVKEERRLRVDNSPFGAGLEKIFSKAYAQDNSYHWPVIGSMSHLESASIQDFQMFYDRFYSPNNAVLVIAGDFNSGKAKKWIQQKFSKIKPQSLNKRPKVMKGYSKSSTTKVRKKVVSKILMMSFPGVSVLDEDAKALDLASSILTNGKTSRMYKKLVDEKRISLSVDSWNFTPKGGGLFMFFNTLRPGQALSKAKKEMKSVLTTVLKEGVSEAELNAAKKKNKFSYLKSFKTLSGKAYGLAQNEVMYGDHRRLFTDLSAYTKISVKDINRVLKKYIKSQNLTVIEVGE